MKSVPVWKFILVGVLAVTLVWVLARPGDDETKAVSDSVSLVTEGDASHRIIADRDQRPTNVRLSNISIDEIPSFNPFAQSQKRRSGISRGESGVSAGEGLSSAPTSSLLVVEAILYDGRNPRAVINGKVVATGDLLDDGRRVVDITPRGVKLNAANER